VEATESQAGQYASSTGRTPDDLKDKIGQRDGLTPGRQNASLEETNRGSRVTLKT
jgi:hypothetical protein